MMRWCGFCSEPSTAMKTICQHRSWNHPILPKPEIQAKWKYVYEHCSDYWTLYELGEKLVDVEDYFRRWRFNHVTTVERVIGF